MLNYSVAELRLKKAVQQCNYMPLELLTAENYIYYTADEK